MNQDNQNTPTPKSTQNNQSIQSFQSSQITQSTPITQNNQSTQSPQSSPTSPITFLPQHGHYRNLLVYQVTEIVYDITYYFTQHYLSKGDRTVDQMVQAARSGIEYHHPSFR